MSTAQNLKDFHGDDIDSMVREVCDICIMSDYHPYEGIHIYEFKDESLMTFARDWSVVTAYD